MTDNNSANLAEAGAHLETVRALLEAALENGGRVREHLWRVAWELDGTLVRALIDEPRYEVLRPMAQTLFPPNPPSESLRQQALDLLRDRRQHAYLEAKGKV